MRPNHVIWPFCQPNQSSHFVQKNIEQPTMCFMIGNGITGRPLCLKMRWCWNVTPGTGKKEHKGRRLASVLTSLKRENEYKWTMNWAG